MNPLDPIPEAKPKAQEEKVSERLVVLYQYEVGMVDMWKKTLMKGTFQITKTTIIFVPELKKSSKSKFYRDYFRVSLYLVERIVRVYSKKRPNDFHLDVFTKDYRHLSIIPKDYVSMEELYS